MAWSKLRAANRVIHLLNERSIKITDEAEASLKNNRFAKILGCNCLVVNVMGTSTFRVRVNTNWFKSNRPETVKPSFRNSIIGFDFQLIPAGSMLYAIYFQALRDYTYQLELEREKWFKQPWWGIEVNSKKGFFIWKGGNQTEFPLTPVCTSQSLFIREKQYLLQKQYLEPAT